MVTCLLINLQLWFLQLQTLLWLQQEWRPCNVCNIEFVILLRIFKAYPPPFIIFLLNNPLQWWVILTGTHPFMVFHLDSWKQFRQCYNRARCWRSAMAFAVAHHHMILWSVCVCHLRCGMCMSGRPNKHTLISANTWHGPTHSLAHTARTFSYNFSGYKCNLI